MQLIIYYVTGHRANANKLTDRCKAGKKKGKTKKNRRQNEQIKTRTLTEGPLRHITIATFALRRTTAPFSFMPLFKSILKLLILPGEDYIHLLIAFFSEKLLSLYKRMSNDFHLLENNNNNSFEVNATHILLCGGSKGQCNRCKQVNRPL